MDGRSPTRPPKRLRNPFLFVVCKVSGVTSHHPLTVVLTEEAHPILSPSWRSSSPMCLAAVPPPRSRVYRGETMRMIACRYSGVVYRAYCEFAIHRHPLYSTFQQSVRTSCTPSKCIPMRHLSTLYFLPVMPSVLPVSCMCALTSYHVLMSLLNRFFGPLLCVLYTEYKDQGEPEIVSDLCCNFYPTLSRSVNTCIYTTIRVQSHHNTPQTAFNVQTTTPTLYCRSAKSSVCCAKSVNYGNDNG